MTDPAAQAFTEQGIGRIGVEIVLQRVFGQPPNTSTFSANVRASVRRAQPDGGAEAQAGAGGSQMGSISQDAREVVVMAHALREKRFPLPIQKGDVVLLPETEETFTVAAVDPYKRALAGAIELTIAGVA